MGFKDRIKGMVSDSAQGGFYFQCTSCKVEFEAETDDKTQIRCPRCGSEIIRTVPGK